MGKELDFLPWEELPLEVKRNKKHMYEYLVSVLNDSESDNNDVDD